MNWHSDQKDAEESSFWPLGLIYFYMPLSDKIWENAFLKRITDADPSSEPINVLQIFRSKDSDRNEILSIHRIFLILPVFLVFSPWEDRMHCRNLSRAVFQQENTLEMLSVRKSCPTSDIPISNTGMTILLRKVRGSPTEQSKPANQLLSQPRSWPTQLQKKQKNISLLHPGIQN